MPPSPSVPPESPANSRPALVETRYSLPALLEEVKRDRSSAAFAMEKLDQPSINLLFEQQRARHDAHPDK